MKRMYKSLRKTAVLLLALMLIFQGTIPVFDLPRGTYALTTAADEPAAASGAAAAAEEPSGEPGGEPAEPEEEKRNERDGSKIEGIDIHWVTPDSRRANNGTATPQDILDSDQYLFLATSSTADLEMKYQVEVSFSGQYDYGPGDIQITIPGKVWHTRQYVDDGNGGQWGVVDPDSFIGGMDLSVPKAPSTRGDFNWQMIDGNYVLTNTKTIGATSKAMFQFTITGLTPHKIVDMSESDPITVHCEVITNKDHVIELTSTPIQAQIDTLAVINGCYKEGELYEELPSGLPSHLLNNLPAEDPDPANYVYVRWYSNKRHTTNQHFTLDIEDTLADAYRYVKDEDGNRVRETVTEGIFLGSSNYSGTIYEHGDGPDFEARLQTNQYRPSTTGGYDTTVVMWSAYKKSDFYVPSAKEPQVVYYFENDVDWILTEADADNNGETAADGKKVTRVHDSAVVTYAPVRWSRPTGHFEVFKYTESAPNKDYYYGYGLNELLKGERVDMRYHLKTVGFGYPWTSIRTNPADPGYVGEDDVTRADFGNLGWRQTTEDFQTFFNLSDEVLTSRDFEMTYLQVTVPNKYRYDKATRPTSAYKEVNGAIVYTKLATGEFGYFYDSSLPNPDLIIEYQVDGGSEWLPAATATWGDTGKGAFSFINVADGITVETGSRKVYFPENTTDVRHIFVSNVHNGKSAVKCDLAAVIWDVYLGIDLKPSPEIVAIAEALFDQSDSPSTKFRNDVQMQVDGWVYTTEEGTPGPGTRLTPGPNSFYDISRATIAGASYGASISKRVSYNRASMENGGDNDTENRRVMLHYSATVTERSNLARRADYDVAVAEGVIPAETSGVWYDLLPEGVAPVMNSVRLSTGEAITAKYTVPNFRDTGRTLLVVEMDMTPTLSTSSGYWQDSFSIYFDAYIGWDEIDDFGTNPVNYIAFESKTEDLRNDTIGTITGQQGEPDDPLGGMNNWTPSMPEHIVAALTGLDENTGETDNRFLYAKADVNLNVNTSAVSGIAKAVCDDFVDNGWTQGLDGQEQVVVYEGHGYTYRLRVSSSQSTITKDIIVYDTIENYHIPDPKDSDVQDPTKEADFNDKEQKKNWQGDWEGVGQWRGTLQSVDLSDFVDADVAPVLYYSVIPDLTFADSTPDMTQDEKLALFSTGAYDISNTGYWQQAELNGRGQWVVPDNLVGRISAVAIDARTNVNGEPFELQPGQAISGYLRMLAPDDNSDPDQWHAKGAYAHKVDADGNPIQEVDWEAAADYKNNMFAFNNTRLKCVQCSEDGFGESSDIMIRNDYTRVGILPGVIGVEKVWDDLDNWDNKRPESITVTLLRRLAGKGGDYEPVLDGSGQPMTVTLSDENDWKDFFLQIDLVNNENVPYIFSFDEGEIEGYTGEIKQLDARHYRLTNTHEKEKIPVAGVKQWNDMDNQPGVRPETIRVTLLRNGVPFRTMTVKADAEGNWSYDFGLQDKYAKGGVEHVYTVEEEYVAKYVSSSEDYTLLVNDWIPYGDLSVVKHLENATPKAKEKEFTFTIELYQERTEEEIAAGAMRKPLLDNYDYEIFQLEADGETWKRVTGGQLTCSSTFTLKGDQKIVIYELPSESTYMITEDEADGFTLTGKVNDTGTIRAGQLCEASFTNTYAASGSTQFNAFKTQTGHGLGKNQHQFQIIDMNEGSATYGEPIRTAYSGTPTNTQDIPEGEVAGVITGEAIAAFGQLDYTHEDHEGTFYYKVVEVNSEKPGYTYDDTEINVIVHVTDNGDGTLTITAVNVETGEDVTLSDGSGMQFENSYHAEGELSLKAWKILHRRELQPGEFRFDLYVYDTAKNEVVGDPIATVSNDAEGNIVFPPISFDQDDVGLDDDNPAKYTYLIVERKGTDATVEYSNQGYVITVTVYDNHDGTLSFVEGSQVGERRKEYCEECYGTGIAWGGARSIVLNEEVITFHGAVVARSGRGANRMVSSSTYYMRLGYHDYTKLFCPECHGHARITDDGICAACSGSGFRSGVATDIGYATAYMLLGDGRLYTWGPTSFINSRGETVYGIEVSDFYCYGGHSYTNRSDYKYVMYFDDPERQYFLKPCEFCDGHGTFPTGVTVTGEQSMPVFENELKPGGLSVTKRVQGSGNPDQLFTFKVRFTDEVDETLGYALTTAAPTPTPTPTPAPAVTPKPTPNTSKQYHAQERELTGYAYAVLDTSTGVLSFFRTTNTKDYLGRNFYMQGQDRMQTGNLIYYLVYENSTSAIPKWNTYGDRIKIKRIVMNGALRPIGLQYFFQGMTNLESIDLSRLDTSRATDMRYMFDECGLSELDLSTFDTRNVKSMNSMFGDCDLSSLNLSSFDTSNVTSMHQMFFDATVDNLDLSGFNTANVTTMEHMFNWFYSDSLDLSSFDTSNVTTMRYMFNFSNIKQLNVTSFDTSNVTNMSGMFRQCSGLTSLDLSSFDTRRANTNGMFEGCRNLSEITLGQNTIISGYPPASTTAPYDGNWVRITGSREVLTGSKLFPTGNHAGTWIWNTPTYKIDFNAGAGAGSMRSRTPYVLMEEKILPTFYRFGYRLIGMSDGQGRTYGVGTDGLITIPANSYSAGAVVTLTALWEKDSTSASENRNEYTFTLFAGETLTFTGIPAGTGFEVWEETPAGWVQVSASGVSGVIEPVDTSQATIVNEYRTNQAQVRIRAGKTMNGESPDADAFEFQLWNSSNSVIQSVKNKAGGAVEFAPITYTLADAGKTFTYTIREIHSSNYRIIHDENVYTVKVTVTDHGNGVLGATAVYLDASGNTLNNPPVFENRDAPGGLRLCKGMGWPSGVSRTDPLVAKNDFIFEVTFTNPDGTPWEGEPVGKVPAKRYVYSDLNNYNTNVVLETYDIVNGKVQVPMSVYTSNLVLYDIPKDTRYEVTELGEYPGWTFYEDYGYGASGVIQPYSYYAAPESTSITCTLVNVYTHKGTVTLEAVKNLVGRTPEDGEFTFQLLDSNGNVIDTVANEAVYMRLNPNAPAGEAPEYGYVHLARFKEITYEKQGTYTYTIREVTGDDDTVEYSDEVIRVTVLAQDLEGEGRLTTTVTYTVDGEESNTITNTVKPGSLSLSKQMISSYAPHKDQEFTFTLYLTDARSQLISGEYAMNNGETLTVTNGQGIITLKGGESVTIEGLPDGASYSIVEAEVSGFTQRSTGAAGKIGANETASASFTNIYTAKGEYVPELVKHLEGLDLTDGQFSFQLLDENGYVLQTVTNDSEGRAVFAPLSFSDEDAGTATFSIVEVNGGAAGMTYDPTVYTISLTITDNGDGTLTVEDDLNGEPVTFVNTYSDKTSLTVNKLWNDEEDRLGLRPQSITVELLQNRIRYCEAVITAENGWSHTFTDLPAFDEDGINYLYEVREVPVPGYTTGITADGRVTTITNSVLGSLEIGKVVAEGDLETAFTFNVTLTKDGEPLTEPVLTDMDGARVEMTPDASGRLTFTLMHGESVLLMGLPIGTEYTVEEEEYPAYTGVVSEGSTSGRIQRNEEQRTVYTNTGYVTSFQVTKQWEGGSGPIELTMYANGVKMDPQPVFTRNGDVYTCRNLPLYDELGNQITYSAREKYFDGFVTIYTNTGEHEGEGNAIYNGGTIINRRIKEADFQVQKIWVGLGKNEHAPRIRLVLYCNGERLDVPTPVPSSGGWYRYHDLPDYYKGVPAVYTVKEEPIAGYSTAYQLANLDASDHADNGGCIINVKLPATGDRSNVTLWLSLLAISGVALVLLAAAKKRRKQP